MSSRQTEKLQHWLKDVITNKGDLRQNLYRAKTQHNLNATDVIASAGTASIHTRLGVYAKGYILRLTECLAADFPVLKKFVGDDVFYAFAQASIEWQPPSSYTLHDLGKNFVRFLETTKPDNKDSLLNGLIDLPVELARLERIRQEVVRSPGNENQVNDTMLSFENMFFNSSNIVISLPESLMLAEFKFPMKNFFNEISSSKDGFYQFPAFSKTFMALSRRNYQIIMEEIPGWQYCFLQQCREKTTLLQAINDTAKQENQPAGKIMAKLFILLPSMIDNAFITAE